MKDFMLQFNKQINKNLRILSKLNLKFDFSFLIHFINTIIFLMNQIIFIYYLKLYWTNLLIQFIKYLDYNYNLIQQVFTLNILY